MPTREELHKLIDSLPEGAIEPAHQILKQAQVWPPSRPSARQTLATQTFTADGKPSSSSLQHWEGDTLVTERKNHFYRHELTVIERIRVDGQRLIYKHEISGPGEKHAEREIIFDLP
jgi:hypothetical protein